MAAAVEAVLEKAAETQCDMGSETGKGCSAVRSRPVAVRATAVKSVVAAAVADRRGCTERQKTKSERISEHKACMERLARELPLASTSGLPGTAREVIEGQPSGRPPECRYWTSCVGDGDAWGT